MNKRMSFLFGVLVACSEAIDNPNPCRSIQVPHLAKVADGTYLGNALHQSFGGAQRKEEFSSLEIKDTQLTLTYKDTTGQTIQKVYKYLGSYERGTAE